MTRPTRLTAATQRSRIGYCQKHASARFAPAVRAERHQSRRFRTSTGIKCERTNTNASDSSIARYYDPATGQFLTRDPLEAETGQPYSYAGDDPVDNSDPTGESWLDDLDPLHWYNEEIQAYESGCGFWDSVGDGIFGAFEAAGEIGGGEVLDEALGALLDAEESSAASSYIDITRGGSVRNIGTDATETEFADALTSNGWTSSVSKSGRVDIFEKDGAKYVLGGVSLMV